jgi:hypothetical protein
MMRRLRINLHGVDAEAFLKLDALRTRVARDGMPAATSSQTDGVRGLPLRGPPCDQLFDVGALSVICSDLES